MNELSLIIPVLSDFERMPAFIDGLSQYLQSNPGDVDVILVVDQTVEQPGSLLAYVHERYPWLPCRVLQKYGRGSVRNYGTLVRFGMAYSHSQYVVLLSSSGEDDLSKIRDMQAALRQGAQVAQATRYLHPEDARQVAWLFRGYQALYRFSIRVLLGLTVSDSTYAFKMFNRVFIQSLGINRNGFSLCPEITVKSLLAGGQVVYIPSSLRPVPGTSTFSLSREGIGYFLVVFRGFLHRCGLLWF
jgi:hypothetical protein